MNKLLILLTCLLFIANPGYTQNSESKITDEERLQWWHEARFGMFIHWGVYRCTPDNTTVTNRREAALSGF